MQREMKDSGIEWIGEIPKDWKKSFVKQHMRWKSIKGRPNELILSLYRDYGIIPKSSRDDNYNVTSLDTSGYKVVDKGDFVINKMKAWQGSMAVSEYHGIISPAYHVCSFTDKTLNKQYIHYLLRCSVYLPEYTRLSTGMRIGQWDLGFDDFKNIPIILPSKTEQDKIVLFLNTQCTEIDSILERTRTSIEEYKKLKQAVITQAVTKGVRGNRPMKDSGIEWIGEIPEDWYKRKLKYYTYIRARLGWKGLKAEEYVEDGYPLLSAFNIVNSKLEFKNVNYINQMRYDESPEIMLVKGDILLVKDGAGIGKCAIVEELPKPSTTNGSLAVITSKCEILPKFLYYYFLSKLFQKYIDRLKDGMGVPHLFQSDLREIQIVVPFITEQNEIADYLDKKCAEIDNLIAKKQQYLMELENYKKSLIYEYVTGKKEVPQ